MEKLNNIGDLKKHLREIVGKDTISIDDANKLSKWKLIEVIKTFGKIRKFKFVRNKSLLGDFEKAMPKEIYEKLLLIEKRDKINLAIKIQGLLALRISEVVILKTDHFDFKNHIVMVWEVKTEKWRHIPICKELERDLIKFISNHKKEIKDHNDFILFSGNVTEQRDHISLNWLAGEIERLIELTGMQRVYAIDSLGKKRHLYTSHSLRGYGIMRFYDASGNNILLTQKFAGHVKIENTMHYVTHDFKKIFEVVRNY